VKKLLIIQMDGAYYLHETLRMLEKYESVFKNFDLTFLTNPDAQDDYLPLLKGHSIDTSKVLESNFDISCNLSLDENSWKLHGLIKSDHKLGPLTKNGVLRVNDLWSTFLLSLKAKPPFLTFHLQDIYRNILNIKKLSYQKAHFVNIREIVVGKIPNDDLFCSKLSELFPLASIELLENCDLIETKTNALYIGQPSLEALKLCDLGAQGIFITRHFHGPNLIPHDGAHFILSTRGKDLDHHYILEFMDALIRHGKVHTQIPYSVYQLDQENLFGSYLRSMNSSDELYPFYQSHVVLWNFLLNLFDVNLEISSCSPAQIVLLEENKSVLSKLTRLHAYALSSMDTVYREAKSETATASVINGHLKNLEEVETLLTGLAESHPLLRPILDFYRIRKGQNEGSTLLEQAQNSLLAYTEEHHALTALNELFTVTLKKNEATI